MTKSEKAESKVLEAEVPGPLDPDFQTPNTAIQQAAATVPGSEAAAEKAFPSDDAVAKLEKVAPSGPKSFRDVVAERTLAERAGEPIPGVSTTGEAYGDPNRGRKVQASKRTEAEISRGRAAAKDAGGFRDQSATQTSMAEQAAAEADRNARAREQKEAILGTELPPETKKGK